jgi:hypothetical protein
MSRRLLLGNAPKCQKCGASIPRFRGEAGLETKAAWLKRKACRACSQKPSFRYRCISTGEVKTIAEWGISLAGRFPGVAAKSAREAVWHSASKGRPAYGLTFEKLEVTP